MSKKVLVVCYSRTGTALEIGREIAAALGADFDAIEDPCDRGGALGFVRSVFEALARGLPSVRTHVDPSKYDLVVLGTPVWAGTMSAPMRSYLFRYGHALRNVALFATMRAVGADQAFQEMRSLCGADYAPCCAFLQHEVEAGRHQHSLAEFVAGLERARDAGSPQPSVAA